MKFIVHSTNLIKFSGEKKIAFEILRNYISTVDFRVVEWFTLRYCLNRHMNGNLMISKTHICFKNLNICCVIFLIRSWTDRQDERKLFRYDCYTVFDLCVSLNWKTDSNPNAVGNTLILTPTPCLLY